MSIAETIVYLMSNALRVFAFSKLIGTFFPERRVKCPVITLCYVLFFAVNSAMHLLFQNPILNIATNLVPLFLICYLYSTKWYMNLMAAVLSFLLGMVAELPMAALLDLSIVFSSGLAATLLFYLLTLLFQTLFRGNIAPNLKWIYVASIIVVPLASIVIAALTMTDYRTVTIIEIACLLVINVFVFYLFGALNKMYIQAQQTAMVAQQNEAYSEQLRIVTQANQRLACFRHDMKNHFYRIRSLLEHQNLEGLREYLDQSHEYLNVQGQYVNSGNMEVDSVINYKLALAEQEGATVSAELKIPEGIHLNAFDINILLSNLLDNAIEAVRHCEEGQRWIGLSMVYAMGVLHINIDNTCVGEPKTRNGSFVTTKDDPLGMHGLGIRSVKETVAKYNGSANFEYNDHIFSARISAFM